MWILFLTFHLSILWFTSCLAESNWTLFEFAEGESELVSGFNVVFERKVLWRILGAVKIDTRRRRNNSELMNLYEDLDIISFIRIIRLRWIGHVNRMDKERKVYNIFYNQIQGTRVRGRPKNLWMDCVLSDIKNAKLQTGRSSQRIEEYWGGPLWRQRSALGCSANEEDMLY